LVFERESFRGKGFFADKTDAIVKLLMPFLKVWLIF